MRNPNSFAQNVYTPTPTPDKGVISGARLRARLDQDVGPIPAPWRADVGDELIATFERWTEGTTGRGETHPVAVLRRLDGDGVAVWCFYRVLLAELRKADPQPGEFVAVRRLEDRTSSGGQRYRVYRVAVDREDTGPTDASPDPHQTDWVLAGGKGAA